MSSSAVSQKRVAYEVVNEFQPARKLEFSFNTAARTERQSREILRIGSSALIALAVVVASLSFVRVPHPFEMALGLAGFLCLISLSSRREIHRRILRRRAEDGNDAERVLIVGAGEVGKALSTYFEEKKSAGYHFVGFLDEDDSANASVLGKPEDLRREAHKHFIDEVFLTTPLQTALTGKLWSDARCAQINVSLVEPPQSHGNSNGNGACTARCPVVAIYRRPEHVLATVLKREFDVILTATLLAVLLPLMLAVAIAVKLDSDGQVLYRCRRLGKRGRLFTCYKFRTMVSDAHAMRDRLTHLNEYEKILFKIREDPRITPLGKFLRKYSLDELPQLWNVLVGDMSLVGPRPPLPEEYEQYSNECRQRLRVKPGITGLWQVTARQNPSFDVYMRLDLQYVENWSLWWDLKILLQTIPAVLHGTGW
ncbi:MAG TPA: sugar transferase [Candidatus Limnocylindria bacterium]|nr:sugar transferase [Candidatus Limnocylindria bacterium]